VPPVVWGLVAAVVAVALVTGFHRPQPHQPRVGPNLPAAEISGDDVRPLRAAQNRAARTPPARYGVERQAPRPTHIRIPAIGVSARIIRLGLAAGGTMQTPKSYSVTGWFAPGAEPGERGPAVIAGHVDSKTSPGVFYKLGDLRRGDSIAITRADHSVIHFKVQGLETWPKASFPTKRVFGRTRTATLRLITCSGPFNSSSGHYVDNTIVYAVHPPRQRPS
jgi:sortase (surface protein transpeptidase)